MAMNILANSGHHVCVQEPEVGALEYLSEDELAALAAGWRAEALRGNRRARGYAHLCEVELRRRRGRLATSRQHSDLDLRPLEQRFRSRPWWKFW